MSIFDSLIGNEELKNTLATQIRERKFLHAYIIEGAKGTGKRLCAKLASCAIMCQDKKDAPCGKCDFCRKIMNDSCTDVRTYDAFKVEDVRKIKETLYETPTECDYKIYILNDVQLMNPKAQNALLISLEEPPKNVIFFLLCTDSGALLETIRSRAQIVRTKPLCDEVIIKYVKENLKASISDSRLKEIVVTSGGSLGYVLDMLDESKAQALISQRETAKKLAISLLNKDKEAYVFVSSLFSMKRENLKSLLQTCCIVLRDMMVVKKDKGAHLCFFTSSNEATETSAPYNLKRLLSAYESVTRALGDTEYNSNVPLTLMSMITDFKK